MQVKGIPVVLASDSDTLTALADMFRPPRLNFAKVCLYCETRFCVSSACVKVHAVSVWGPCPDCDGFGSCTCLNGVVEMDRAGLAEFIGRTLPQRRAAAEFAVVA
ncbi:hypothetical protein GA0070216_111178 [Micromonospora matsumotoense]|uniref:Uncharacterized protein n=1 Tax=Micromonospora matsumotoense TaxID=121616 RepID=A0A1C4ZVX3_9ACTN|nr:hypothetical protein [Micromonospora matsumotoense]SCF37093.1 hypothetical protein GA0070216_111178 [Micromonospora matsumotoense]